MLQGAFLLVFNFSSWVLSYAIVQQKLSMAKNDKNWDIISGHECQNPHTFWPSLQIHLNKTQNTRCSQIMLFFPPINCVNSNKK